MKPVEGQPQPLVRELAYEITSTIEPFGIGLDKGKMVESVIGKFFAKYGIYAPAPKGRQNTDIHEAIGRIMHESWAKTKRAQGFHGPNESCPVCLEYKEHCPKFHADLIPWEQLPEKQKDINRHAFDAVLESGLLVPAAPREHDEAGFGEATEAPTGLVYQPTTTGGSYTEADVSKCPKCGSTDITIGNIYAVQDKEGMNAACYCCQQNIFVERRVFQRRKGREGVEGGNYYLGESTATRIGRDRRQQDRRKQGREGNG